MNVRVVTYQKIKGFTWNGYNKLDKKDKDMLK